MPEFISILRWIRDVVYPKVAEIKENLDIVAENIDDVNTNANNIESIKASATIKNNIVSVSENIEKINNVSGNIERIADASNFAYRTDLIVPVETIEQMLSLTPLDKDTAIVKDINRGGTFIYDATKSAVNNGGTIFDGWVRQYNGAVNVKWFGAKGDGIKDDTNAIQKAILHDYVFIPKGTYKIGQITVTDCKHLFGAGTDNTKLIYTGNSKCIYLATNNSPIMEKFTIENAIINDVFSRTNIGLDVFGNTAGGSSIHPIIRDIRIEGFNIGLQVAGAFISSFENLTMKRNDISYNLLNDTNTSTWFRGCASNNQVGQHIVSNALASSSAGGSFTDCEFENGNRFPFFKFIGTVLINFNNCYCGENNFDDGTGDFFGVQMTNGGIFEWTGGALGVDGKADARVIHARKTTFPYTRINITNTLLIANRTVGVLIDNEILDNVDLDYAHIANTTIKNTVLINCFNSPSEGTIFKTDGSKYKSKVSGVEFTRGNSLLDDYSKGSYIPTWTNLIVGNAPVNKANYIKVGNKVTVSVALTLGSTSVVSGSVSFSIPFVSNLDTLAYGVGNLLDDGTENYLARTEVYVNSSSCYIKYSKIAGPLIANASISATLPFTWVAGDKINASITYISQ